MRESGALPTAMSTVRLRLRPSGRLSLGGTGRFTQQSRRGIATPNRLEPAARASLLAPHRPPAAFWKDPDRSALKDKPSPVLVSLGNRFRLPVAHPGFGLPVWSQPPPGIECCATIRGLAFKIRHPSPA